MRVESLSQEIPIKTDVIHETPKLKAINSQKALVAIILHAWVFLFSYISDVISFCLTFFIITFIFHPFIFYFYSEFTILVKIWQKQISINRFKNIEIIQILFSDYNWIKLESNNGKRAGKYLNISRLNRIL